MKLEDLKGTLMGRRVMVLGLGPSIKNLPLDHDVSHCIGVNDIWRWHKTPYVVVADRPIDFQERKPDALPIMKETRPKAFLCYNEYAEHWRGGGNIPWDQPNLVEWRMQDIGLKQSQLMSPIYAARLASYMGATEIGLLGVDMNKHNLVDKGHLPKINAFCAELLRWCESRGAKVWNLSALSAINTLPKKPLTDFLRTPSGGGAKSLPAGAPRATGSGRGGIPSIDR